MNVREVKEVSEVKEFSKKEDRGESSSSRRSIKGSEQATNNVPIQQQERKSEEKSYQEVQLPSTGINYVQIKGEVFIGVVGLMLTLTLLIYLGKRRY